MDHKHASYRITDLAQSDRPRERLASLGAAALSNAELLAILLRSGVAGRNVLQLAQDLLLDELGRRLAVARPSDRPAIRSPEDAAALLLYEMSAMEQEHLRVLLLDTKNQLLRIVEVYHGSLNSSLIRVGEVFRDAVRSNAAAILVAHNHPSGDPAPSPEDVVVTRAIVDAGKLLDIEVLDHIVIGGGKFVSLKSRGLGFSIS